MKKIICALVFLLSAHRVFSAPVIRSDGSGITFAKWQLAATGELFYTDAERDAAIVARNVFSSTGVVLAAGSFTNITPSANVVAFTTTVYSGTLQPDGLTVTSMSVDALFRPYWDIAKQTVDGNGQLNYAPYASFKEALDDQLLNKAAMEIVAIPYINFGAGLDFASTKRATTLTAKIRKNDSILEFIRRIYPGLQ